MNSKFERSCNCKNVNCYPQILRLCVQLKKDAKHSIGYSRSLNCVNKLEVIRHLPHFNFQEKATVNVKLRPMKGTK